jgi:hypothetical protein
MAFEINSSGAISIITKTFNHASFIKIIYPGEGPRQSRTQSRELSGYPLLCLHEYQMDSLIYSQVSANFDLANLNSIQVREIDRGTSIQEKLFHPRP